MYVFAPYYVTAQRETSATPWRSGYGDKSSPGSLGLGLVSTANSPGSCLSDIPFFAFSTSTWMSSKPRMVGGIFLLDLLPQLTAAAGNYAYVYLRIWVGQTSLWYPADIFIADMDMHFLDPSIHVDLFLLLCFRDTGAIGSGF
jgi:hypothetical protein